MNILEGLANTLTGGLAKEVVSLVTAYLPPDIPPEKKLELELRAQELETQKYKNADDAIDAAAQTLNERIKTYEGTAADLKTIPYLGAFMIFLRGSFRNVMAYFVMYLDFMVYIGGKTITDPDLKTNFFLVNFLVLGFFFGEKTIQNVVPLVIQIMAAKKA